MNNTFVLCSSRCFKVSSIHTVRFIVISSFYTSSLQLFKWLTGPAVSNSSWLSESVTQVSSVARLRLTGSEEMNDSNWGRVTASWRWEEEEPVSGRKCVQNKVSICTRKVSVSTSETCSKIFWIDVSICGRTDRQNKIILIIQQNSFT